MPILLLGFHPSADLFSFLIFIFQGDIAIFIIVSEKAILQSILIFSFLLQFKSTFIKDFNDAFEFSIFVISLFNLFSKLIHHPGSMEDAIMVSGFEVYLVAIGHPHRDTLQLTIDIIIDQADIALRTILDPLTGLF